MHVASLELCKELYELSGWDDPDKLNSYGLRVDNDVNPFQCPAYPLGYLLRKLPQSHKNNMLSLDRTSLKIWCCGYFSPDYTVDMSTMAGTPEDAATRLAVELFKQGILTKAS